MDSIVSVRPTVRVIVRRIYDLRRPRVVEGIWDSPWGSGCFPRVDFPRGWVHARVLVNHHHHAHLVLLAVALLELDQPPTVPAARFKQAREASMRPARLYRSVFLHCVAKAVDPIWIPSAYRSALIVPDGFEAHGIQAAAGGGADVLI